MRFLISFLVALTISLNVNGQEINLEIPLENGVMETSGLIYLNGTLITHNDSGGNAELYEIDINTGNITRTVEITNAINVDWEDISHDDTYIYIGDFGNNNGTRTDLKIYKILIDDYTNTIDDTVTAEIINFSYVNQTDFSSQPFNTNFDAEALVCYQNRLYIFTKNWVDFKTNVYSVSKTPGNYSLSIVNTIDTEGLVTGAVYNPVWNHIVLIGYNLPSPRFVMVFSDVEDDMFSESIYVRGDILDTTSYSNQIEGIAFFDDLEYFVSAEDSATGDQALFNMFYFELLSTSSSQKDDFNLYPNPTSSTVTISTTNFKSAKIYSPEGRLVLTSKTQHIDISNLSSGSYIVVIKGQNEQEIQTKKLVVN